jgi:Ca2+-binding EF-hand superfamily protein
MSCTTRAGQGQVQGQGQDHVWKSEDAQWRALFSALDKDCNGYVDKQELRETMLQVGLELSDQDLDTMMKVAGVAIKDRIFYEGISFFQALLLRMKC